MALVLKDRVLETCAAPGAGVVTLLGPVTGYQAFSSVGNGNTCYYAIADQNGSNWEVGIGTYATSGNTLTRTTILSSSNAGSTVNFTSGVQNVFVTYPSERSVNLSSAALTLNRVTYATTDGLLTDSANMTFDGSTLTTLNSAYTGTLTGGTGVVNLGSGQFYKDASGNVGIGTSSPGVKLAVNGAIAALAGNFVYYQNTATNSNFSLQNVGSTGTSALAFASDGAERMRIDSSGNVGIGTSSPSYKLDVLGASNNPTFIRCSVTGTNAGAGFIFAGAITTQKNWVIANQYNVNGGLEFTQTTTAGGSTIGSTPTMVLSASGNVGIGGTPLSDSRLLISNGGAVGMEFSPNIAIANENRLLSYNRGTSAYAPMNYDASTQQFLTGGSERMRIDSSGRVLIGTTTAGIGANGSTALTIANGTATVYASLKASGGQEMLLGADNTNGVYFGSFSNNDLSFRTNNIERMRIDSSGNLLVGTTSSLANGKTSIYNSGTGNGLDVRIVGSATGYSVYTARVDNTANLLHTFFYGNYSTVVGSITTNGVITVYNTTSDYRLKNNQAPLTGSGEFIDALQPKTWEWAQDGSKGAGFIAHEFAEVSPSSVNGTKDAVDADGKPVYQAMQASSAEVIANLVAEIQSLRKRVAQIESK